jgi:hypothetical protein
MAERSHRWGRGRAAGGVRQRGQGPCVNEGEGGRWVGPKSEPG